VGTQIYAAARQLYSRHRAYLEDSEPSDSKKLLEKFVFLAERILSRDESPEGYRYESLRLQKLFSLSTPTWNDMAANAAVPFYSKALNSAVLEGKPVSAKNLAAVRQSLGVLDRTAEEMHADVFGQAAARMLEDGGALSASDKENLAAVQALLAMNSDAARRAMQTLTAPLYTTAVTDVLSAIDGVDGELDGGFTSAQANVLAASQAELLLDPADAYGIEVEVMRASASAKLLDAVTFLRAQNLPECLAATRTLVSFREARGVHGGGG